jgi:hypothetical protein
MGRALAPLRGKDVLVLASGGATHNLSELEWGRHDNPPVWARAFDVLGGYMIGTGAISFVGAASQWLIMVLLGLPLAFPVFVNDTHGLELCDGLPDALCRKEVFLFLVFGLAETSLLARKPAQSCRLGCACLGHGFADLIHLALRVGSVLLLRLMRRGQQIPDFLN